MARQTPIEELHGMKGAMRPAQAAAASRRARAPFGRGSVPAKPAAPVAARPAVKLALPRAALDWIVFAAATLWPAWLWWTGRLLATDVLLVFVLEALLYHVGVLARILFRTTAQGHGFLPRPFVAVRHAIQHGIWMVLLVALLLLAIGIPPDPDVLLATARAHLARLSTPAIAQATGVVAVCFAVAFITRSDDIDTHLGEPPARFARYGYSYVFGLAFLLVASLVASLFAREEGMLAPFAPGNPLTPPIPPEAMVVMLLALRSAAKLIGLIFRLFQGKVDTSLEALKERVEAAKRSAKA